MRKAGTTRGTALHPFQWNERWNAERRIASNGAGSRWNDAWNDARIATLQRSTHSLRVEQWNGKRCAGTLTVPRARSVERIQYTTKIKVRAEPKAGAMLAEMPKAQGAKLKGRAPDGAFRQSHDDSAQTLADVGVTPMQSSRWQSLASMTDEHFDQRPSSGGQVFRQSTAPDGPIAPSAAAVRLPVRQ